MKNKMENSILKDNLDDLISSTISAMSLFGLIHTWNKLNNPSHVEQIVYRAIQPSLILIQSRKVERVITTTLRVTRVARRGGYETFLYLGAAIPGLWTIFIADHTVLFPANSEKRRYTDL